MKSAVLSGQGLPIPHIEIIFTTSRDAPLRVRRFLNELVALFPYSIKVNRGRQSLESILSRSLYAQAKYLVMVDVIKGNPGRLKVYDLVTNFVKYSLKIEGVTLLIELNLSRTIVKRGCLGKIDNDEIKSLLLDLGYTSIENCDVYAFGQYVNRNDNKIFELKFLRDDKILGPIIRFALYDRDQNNY